LSTGHTGRPDRIVSLHDPDARAIVKGRSATWVEFGYKPSASLTKTV